MAITEKALDLTEQSQDLNFPNLLPLPTCAEIIEACHIPGFGFLIFLTIFLFILFAHGHVPATACIWMSKDSVWEHVLFCGSRGLN